MGYPIPSGNATYPLIFKLRNATDGQSPVTGATPTVLLSKAGAAYAAPAGAVTEVGDGAYKVAANATDANTLGPIDLYATATGAAPAMDQFLVVAYNPFDSAALGLSRVDAAISTRATPAQILATPANLLATDVSGKVTTGNVTVGGYATGQDPATLLLAAALSPNPTVGTVAESLAYARSLAGGLKIVNTGTGTIDLYAHDKITKLVTVTLAPSLTAPTSETPNR